MIKYHLQPPTNLGTGAKIKILIHTLQQSMQEFMIFMEMTMQSLMRNQDILI